MLSDVADADADSDGMMMGLCIVAVAGPDGGVDDARVMSDGEGTRCCDDVVERRTGETSEEADDALLSPLDVEMVCV